MSSLRKRSAESEMPISNKKGTHDMFKVINVPRLPMDIEIPELPIIEDKAIVKQVFTHSSAVNQARARFNFGEGGGELLDNEKLEWVGDGILSTSHVHSSGLIWI